MSQFIMRGFFAPWVQRADLASETISTAGERRFLAYSIGADQGVIGNDIHPIFGIHHWKDLDENRHNAIFPALRIVSQLIRQDVVLNLFAHVLVAPIDEAARRDTARETLLAIANTWSVTFDLDPRAHCTCLEDMSHVQVYMSPHLFYNAELLLDIGSPADYELSQLRIALMLCRQLIHLMWLRRVRNDDGIAREQHLKYGEPRIILNGSRTEFGDALETCLFGNTLFFSDHPMDIMAYYEVKENDDTIRVIVPRWWTHIWFNSKLWNPRCFEQLWMTQSLMLPRRAESFHEFRFNSISGLWDVCMFSHPCGFGFLWPREDWNVAKDAMETAWFQEIRRSNRAQYHKNNLSQSSSPSFDGATVHQPQQHSEEQIDVHLDQQQSLLQVFPLSNPAYHYLEAPPPLYQEVELSLRPEDMMEAAQNLPDQHPIQRDVFLPPPILATAHDVLSPQQMDDLASSATQEEERP
ncbi:hypothetical protein ACEQ8H_001928 [Pleosporales sp. CAS-2024a]